MWLTHGVVTARAFGYTITLNMSEQVSYEQSLHSKATLTPALPNTRSACITQRLDSPFLPGDDEDVIEEEEIDLLP